MRVWAEDVDDATADDGVRSGERLRDDDRCRRRFGGGGVGKGAGREGEGV